MKRYLVRSVKYLIALCVLYVALMWLMHISSSRQITFIEEWQLLFSTWRGYMMVVALLLLAAAYPKFGFVRRRVVGNIIADREQIETAFRVAGFVAVSDEGGELLFRAHGVRRLTMLFEDDVVVRQVGDELEFDGLRRATVPIAYTVERYLENKHRTDE